MHCNEYVSGQLISDYLVVWVTLVLIVPLYSTHATCESIGLTFITVQFWCQDRLVYCWLCTLKQL